MSEGSERRAVIIYTRNYQIKGEIGLLPGCRLTDYMNEGKSFIAVLNAQLQTHAGRPVLEAGLVNINLRLIEVIAPVESLVPEK